MKPTLDASTDRPEIRYAIYFAILSPLLIPADMIPIYLYLRNVRPVTIGILYAVGTAIEAGVPYLVGNVFGRVALTTIMGFDNLLVGVSYICVATGGIAGAAMGLFLLRLSRALSCVYPTYSHLVMPEESRVKARALYLALPEYTQGVGFLVMGILLGILWSQEAAYRVSFLVFGLLSVASCWLPVVFLPKMEGKLEFKRLDFSQLRLCRHPIVVTDLLIYLTGCLIPTIVWTLYAVRTLNGTYLLIALVECMSSISVIAGSRLTTALDRAKGLYGGIMVMGVATLMVIKPTVWPVMVLSYGLWSLGSALWDPHHIDLLFSVVPREDSRAFFGTLSSAKKILIILTLPLATALSESGAGLNYGIASLLYLASVVAYRWVLSNPASVRQEAGRS